MQIDTRPTTDRQEGTRIRRRQQTEYTGTEHFESTHIFLFIYNELVLNR